MKRSYHVIDKKDSRKIAEYLTKDAQYLLPMVELIEGSRVVLDELIDVMGRACIEAVLTVSAEGIAGKKQRGRKGGDVCWHGSQGGIVALADRKVRVSKPRLRRKCGGKGCEVEVPAYEAINANGQAGRHILEALMRGVSTRSYGQVITEMADTVGVSRSSISREFIEGSQAELDRLMSRRFDDVDLLILYVDGIVYHDHHVIGAVGVDVEGKKHVLGVVEGATENGATATALLEDMVSRGVDPSRRYLFVIDGSKALRSGIDRVFGGKNPVQRCRNHKMDNVCDKLPRELAAEVRLVMKAAYRLSHEDGIKRIEKQAEWLDGHYPDAAASLREGLTETFTINRLGLSSRLRRCLGTTNIIESPYSGVRMRTRRVSRWRDGRMVLRWVATSFLAVEKSFRRISGYQDLWMLKSALEDDSYVENAKQVA